MPFLVKLFGVYEIPDRHSEHYAIVRAMRTYLQHNLGLRSSSDLDVRATCEGWFSRNCGSVWPGDESEWHECLVALPSDASGFVEAIVDCVRQIERDESRETLLDQWRLRLSPNPPKV